MGIKIAAENDYANAIRGLFPQGEYWERQFADSESDLNLFCRAKAPEIVRLRKRMRDLLAESNYRTAVETIGDWERVMLGHMNVQLPLEERRKILNAKEAQILNRMAIAGMAQAFGFALTDIQFPCRPAFFGFSRFGIDPAATPASWQAVVLHVSTQGNDDHIAEFETHVNNVLANYILYFSYNGGKI